MRTILNRIGICALGIAIGATAAGRGPVKAGEPVSARVSPVVGIAPSDIVIQVTIEPSALNRALSFVVESPTFYSSSVIELDGDRAPRSKEVRFRGMPAGAYEVRVTLLGATGERGIVVHEVDLS